MKKFLFFAFILILSACTSPQVTEETDCCLAVDVTISATTETPTPNIIPTPDQTQTAMVDERIALQTLVAEFPSICEDRYYSYSLDHISPNGLWQEELCYSESDKSLVLTVSNKNTKILWKIIYRDYVPKSDFVLDGGISVSHWSNDGRYAYFYSYPNSSGGGCFRPYNSNGGWGLSRLDLQTGNITSILPIIDLNVGYSFSFSPTDSKLVYRRSQESILILDMKTGETLKVDHDKDFEDDGGYLWSSDGLRFVYSTGTFTNTAEIYSLRLVDVLTGNEKILLESEVTALLQGNCYIAKEWQENILKIEKNYSQTIVEFDLNTNTIISETPINP